MTLWVVEVHFKGNRDATLMGASLNRSAAEKLADQFNEEFCGWECFYVKGYDFDENNCVVWG